RRDRYDHTRYLEAAGGCRPDREAGMGVLESWIVRIRGSQTEVRACRSQNGGGGMAGAGAARGGVNAGAGGPGVAPRGSGPRRGVTRGDWAERGGGGGGKTEGARRRNRELAGDLEAGGGAGVNLDGPGARGARGCVADRYALDPGGAHGNLESVDAVVAVPEG